MTELREKFEELAYKNKWNICKYPKSDYHTKEGEYCDDFVNGAWWAFQEQQKQLDDAKRKYDALYNAFTVTDDARKEWYRCYMGVRQREDELQENIDQINQRAIDQAAHLQRVQEHNAKLQKRLKENGIPWKDLI